jgi:hypothetical protein
LFYFAGHGVQVGGENYLIPVRARISREQDVPYEAVPVGRILGSMEDAANGFNILILDACRDNPFARQWRSSQRGLAVTQAVAGSLIAYATAPGAVAIDGSGRNGLYTTYILQHLPTPGLSVEHLFKRVRESVVKVTKGKQTPWESSSLMGDFLFASSSGSTPLIGTNPGLSPLGGSSAPTPTGPDPEAVMWALVEKSTDPADVQAFLDAYPKSRLTPAARLKFQQLQRLAAQQRSGDPQHLADQERQQRAEAQRREDERKQRERDAAATQQRAEAQRREDERKQREEAKRREGQPPQVTKDSPSPPPAQMARVEPETTLRERASVAVPAATISWQRSGEPWSQKVSAFRLDLHPISNDEFLAFVRLSPQWKKSHMDKTLHDGDYLKHWPSDETTPLDERDRPVRYVSYFAAEAYCKASGKKLPGLNHYRIATGLNEARTIEITYEGPYQAPTFSFMHVEWTSSWWGIGAPDPGKRLKYQHGTFHTSRVKDVEYTPEEDKRYTGRSLGFRCTKN